MNIFPYKLIGKYYTWNIMKRSVKSKIEHAFGILHWMDKYDESFDNCMEERLSYHTTPVLKCGGT